MLKVKGSSSQELVFIMSILCASSYDSYVKILLCKWQEILNRICLTKKKSPFLSMCYADSCGRIWQTLRNKIFRIQMCLGSRLWSVVTF